VNITISIAATIGIIVSFFPFVLRIIFGVFHKNLVIGCYYIDRAAVNYIFNLLSSKNFLRIAFLHDFDRASGTFS
jgi:hypothetical protein